MKCQEVAPDIEAYVIGALSQEEMSAIENHLEQCASCRALVEQYKLTLESLALEASRDSLEFEPIPGHKERFLARLEQRPQLRPGSKSAEELNEAVKAARPQPQNSRQTRTGGWWGRFAPAALGLMLLLVIGLGFWTFNLSGQLDQQQIQNRALASQLAQQNLDVNKIKQLNEQLLEQNEALNRQVSTVSSERDNFKQQVGQLIAAGEQVKVSQNISLLLTKPGATTRTALSENQSGVTVLMAPNEKDVALFAHSWPKLQEGQEYRVWLYHTTGALISGGSLKLLPLPDQNLAEALINVPEPMSNYTTLFITIEKPGVQTPTGPEIVRDKLA
jgi:anti-sigma-K factor RskA